MVTPERETPGDRAIAWATPMPSACGQRRSAIDLSSRAVRSASSMTRAKANIMMQIR